MATRRHSIVYRARCASIVIGLAALMVLVVVGAACMQGCTPAQQHTLHDALDGVHAVCEGADPGLHLLLQRTTADAGHD